MGGETDRYIEAYFSCSFRENAQSILMSELLSFSIWRRFYLEEIYTSSSDMPVSVYQST